MHYCHRPHDNAFQKDRFPMRTNNGKDGMEGFFTNLVHDS